MGGGIITLCGALSLAEVAAALPATGGIYAYLREAWGRRPAFLFGWGELILIRASGLGGIAVVFGEYLLRSFGVDPTERTALVTRGPFRFVRNPIYSAMLVYVTGVALIVPNAASVIALVLLAIAIDLHVRLVEEPYLVATHGADYASYCDRVGRFVPGVGRVVRSAHTPPD